MSTPANTSTEKLVQKSTQRAKKLDDPYKNSNVSLPTSPVDVENQGMIKFLPRVRAWDPFSVKHPLMNDQYLFARRGEKQEDGHTGTTRITVSPVSNCRNLNLERSQLLMCPGSENAKRIFGVFLGNN